MLTSQARRFGDALIDRHVLAREEVDAALEEAARTGASFPEVLGASHSIPGPELAAASGSTTTVAKST